MGAFHVFYVNGNEAQHYGGNRARAIEEGTRSGGAARPQHQRVTGR
jgi:hypothetical protein